MYGKVAYPLGLSFSAKRLKNGPTSSSGDSTRVLLEVESLKLKGNGDKIFSHLI